jgi:SAM-dependent methyltransferase
MNWTSKARLLQALSATPGGSIVHHALQRYVSRSLPRPDSELDEICEVAVRLVAHYRRFSERPDQSRWFEFGAGRDLSNALALVKHGVASVHAVDIKRLAKLPYVRAAARKIVGKEIESWSNLTDVGVTYEAPADARNTTHPAGSFDCVTSWNTLQNIPETDIAAIYEEAHRILKPGGLMIHKIDYCDQYSLSDGSISRFNFLTIESDEWDRYQSPLLYQNRLRHSQHRALIERAGFDVLLEAPRRHVPEPDVVRRLKPPFAEMPVDDLFTAGAVIAARRRERQRDLSSTPAS